NDINVTSGAEVTVSSALSSREGNISINASGALNVNGSALNTVRNIMLVSSDGTLTVNNASMSGGNITLNGTTNLSGIALNISNSTLNAAMLNLSGHANDNGNGVLVQNSSLVGGGVAVNGNTADVSGSAYGVSLLNVTLNASTANITGVATHTRGGAGFILANMTLQGGVGDLQNIVLNASGSSEQAISSLDSSVIRSSSDLTEIVKRDLGSATTVDASTLNLTFDSSGWSNNGTASCSSLPLSEMNTAHDWILSNATVVSEGNVALKGISFSNSTLNISGTLALSSDRWAVLGNGNSINATGNVTLNGTAGVMLSGITLQNSTRFSASGPVILLRNDSSPLSLSRSTLNASQGIQADGRYN
ncbi:hypothetical protein ACDA27_004696, partial [Salmonella enterica]